jgi:hypothetical protein
LLCYSYRQYLLGNHKNFMKTDESGLWFMMFNTTFNNISVISWQSVLKLGTYLVLKRIWNPIDFQGQRSRSRSNFYPVTSF